MRPRIVLRQGEKKKNSNVLIQSDQKGTETGIIEETKDPSCIPAELFVLHLAQELL